MIKMKNLIKNESGVIFPILNTLESLFYIILTFAIFVPFVYFIGDQMIALGAPAPIIELYRKMMLFGFVIFLAAAILILIAKVYKKTTDTQRFN